MYGIPQTSHLGAAVWWEERKLRKSCNRSRNEETVFVPTVRRSRIQEASIKPSWYWTHTHTHTHTHWRALIRTVTRDWIRTLLHYAFGLQAAGMDASVMVGRGTGGAAVFILIVFIVLLGARSSRAQKGTWSSERVKVLGVAKLLLNGFTTTLGFRTDCGFTTNSWGGVGVAVNDPDW